MNLVGIVAEYNPFHNGHAYQIKKIKEELDPDGIIVVMSQDSLQRGEFASFDKWWRAEKALEAGADLVIALPHFVSSQSAEYFARGALKLLNEFGVTTLCFGSEIDNKESFIQSADILINETDLFKEEIKGNLKKGNSLPKAYDLAIQTIHTKMESGIFSNPNATLGIEYTKAILENNYPIEIYPIKREGSGYHDLEIGTLMSAQGIRKALEDNELDFLEGAVPYSLTELEENYTPIDKEKLFSILKYSLLTKNKEDLKEIAGFRMDDINRFFNSINESENMDEFIEKVKSKNITQTRINRLILSLITNTTKEEMYEFYEDTEPFAYILGMSPTGRKLLKQMDIPIITTPSKQVSNLSKKQKAILEKDNEIANLKCYFSDQKDYNSIYLSHPRILK